VDAVTEALTDAGEAPVRIGVMEARSDTPVVFDGLSNAWLS
jgi:hypothetical protein